MADRRVLVPGASSLVGVRALPRLRAAGWDVQALSRAARPDRGEVRWLAPDGPLSSVDAVLALLPVWSLRGVLDRLTGPPPRRIVALSSTSAVTKVASRDPREQEVARLLAQGEQDLRAWCESRGVAWVVLRPTLIYGHGLDRNITALAQVARRWGVLPIVGGGRGLRQPVHVDDVADAAIAALDAPAAAGQAYVLSGGERLSYAAMASRVFEAAGRTPRLLPVPLSLARAALGVARVAPRYRPYSPAMFDRMLDDLVFDHDAATRDLGFRPRPFTPTADDVPA